MTNGLNVEKIVQFKIWVTIWIHFKFYLFGQKLSLKLFNSKLDSMNYSIEITLNMRAEGLDAAMGLSQFLD